MDKEFIIFNKTELAKNSDKNIIAIAEKRGILFPSPHLAIFKSIYAKIEEPNGNNVRLSEKAVMKSLTTLIGKQANINHYGHGFICGAILDAWLNDNKEIEIAFTFYKDVYADEYKEALELMYNNELAVSFELDYNAKSQEYLSDGTRRINDLIFSGVGFLMGEKPAYKHAKPFEVASRVLNRLGSNPELIFASELKKQCEEIIMKENEQAAKWTRKFINSLPNSSFAVIEPAFLSGKTDNKNARHLPFKDASGKVDLPHLRNALARANQIQSITDSISTEELRAKAMAELEKHKGELKTSKAELTVEEKAEIEKIKAELGDIVADFSEEDFLDVDAIKTARDEKTQETPVVKTEETKVTAVEPVPVTTSTDTANHVITTEVNNTTTETHDKDSNTINEKVDVTRTITVDGKPSSVETTKSDVTNTITFTQAQMDEVKASYEKQIQDLKTENEEIEAAIPAEVTKRVKELIKEGKSSKDAVKQAWDEFKKSTKKAAEVLATIKAGLKDNPHVKDFTDEDYLNDTKVENARLKKENDDLKSVPVKEVATQTTETLETGHETSTEKDSDNCQKTVDNRVKEILKKRKK